MSDGWTLHKSLPCKGDHVESCSVRLFLSSGTNRFLRVHVSFLLQSCDFVSVTPRLELVRCARFL